MIRWVLVAIVILFLGSLIQAAYSENFEVQMTREAPLLRSREEAIRLLQTPQEWTQWNHHVREVTAGTIPDSWKWKLIPPGKPWKSFELLVSSPNPNPSEVREFVLLEDSSKRLTQGFQHLTWKIEVKETSVLVHISGKTRSMRARWFARWMPRIFMNQVLSANAQALAGLPDVEALDLSPPRS